MTVKRNPVTDTDATQALVTTDQTLALPGVAPARNVLIHFADIILTKATLSAADVMEKWEAEACEKALIHLTKTMNQVYILFKSTKPENIARVADWMQKSKFVDRNHLTWDRIIFCETENQMDTIFKLLNITHVVHPDINKATYYKNVQVVLADWGKQYAVQLNPSEKKYITRAYTWLDIQSLLTTGKLNKEIQEV